MFNPISAAENIKEEYIGYISTLFHISDRDYARQFQAALNEAGAVTKGPYLDISDSYKTGLSLEALIDEGEAFPLFRTLEGEIPDGDKEIKIRRSLYLHQEKALRKINQGRNLIVTTGTGSGKTECFIIPIINHLLREKETGSLGPGVRAILIYPMNALANDQMKRLRNLLKSCPDITFGVYNSSTKYTDADGIAEYGKVYKDADGYPLKPLPNEIISRERMQETPPHILVTNYAMLEYMLLRPKDDRVFSGAQLRFLVLDEAHIYRGATGMETSLLLKRLKARISDPTKVLHILTSATLGGREADSDIVRFADTLCNASFHTNDIIRSAPVEPSYDKEPADIPLALFSDLAGAKKPLDRIAEDHGIRIPDGQSDPEFLYDLCVGSSVYRDLRKAAFHPVTVPEITAALSHGRSVTQQDVVNVISVAAQASKNKSALIKARYHMFAKAPEGAYITLGKYKRLMLNRTRSLDIDGEERKVFECAVCDDCGRLAVAGREVNGRLEFANNAHDSQIEYYLLRDSRDKDFDNDDDEDGIEDVEKEDYRLCAKCGALIHESLIDDPPCTCGIDNYVRIRKAKKSITRGDARCPSCNLGDLKTVYLGYDAATAVLGTSLFEELPESETVLKSERKTVPVKNSIFGRAKQERPTEIVKRKRQFLSFSDSRGEAAFFASYMTASYKEFLRRRGIWHIIEKNSENMARHPWEIRHFVDELTAYFDACRTFAEPGDRGTENLTAVSRKNAWIAVLNEMVNARRSTSLSSLGVLKFNYKGNSENALQGAANSLQMNVSDLKALFDLLVMDIVYHGALEGDCDLSDDEREYIYYTARPKRVKRCRDLSRDRKKSYLAGWAAAVRANKDGSTSYVKNGRLNRLMKVLNIDEAAANELLEGYWDVFLMSNEPLTSAGNEEFFFRTDRFTISSGTDAEPVYVCDVCGKTTMTNCKDMCPTLKCGGHLHPVSREELIETNHYATLYRSSLMQPLHIMEHTAQLGREEQQKYQEMFVNKDINALSCSTTFEMGVDVGDLETVYLRDVPPSPANYVQRAGRAGRGKNAAAFSLTYAKLSSHDFTYYKDPESMISGKIGVPLFSVRNEKVIRRHIFSVALSDFFAKQPEVYDSNNADVLLNGDGWERLCAYLNSKPEHLKEILRASIPDHMHDVMGISNYSWTDSLIGKDGVLAVAVKDFRDTVQYYQDEYDRLVADGQIQEAAAVEKRLASFRRGKKDNRGRNDLIEFLVRNNVLPKYGFPVDTVELYQNANTPSDKKLQMVRDLQLAISEYAPDSQIVADGKLYTSRYIRKLPQTTGQDWETVYIAQCANPSCQTWNHRSLEPSSEEACISCGEPIARNRWMTAIEPRKGFVADATPKDVPMRKPEKSYRSDDYYIGDVQRQVIQRYDFVTREGSRLEMDTSVNDSLMVVCNDDFYVCPHCGYAESTTENKEKAGFNSHQKTMERKHSTPWGKTCETILVKNKLVHVFKTDVVRLVFNTPNAGKQDVMYSVLYALLEAMSAVLDIERNDIKGCLHKVVIDGKLIYSLVLYDAVAGGAGHVRRLVTGSGDVFSKVVEKALEITTGCTCSPSCYSCLRNYYNQKLHDLLDREKAAAFLEEWSGALDRDDSTVREDTEESPRMITLGEDLGMNMRDSSWKAIWDNMISMTDDPADEDRIHAMRDAGTVFTGKEKPYFDCYFTCGEEYACDLVWPRSRVMLFTEENHAGYEAAKQTDWTCFCVGDIDLTAEKLAAALKEE